MKDPYEEYREQLGELAVYLLNLAGIETENPEAPGYEESNFFKNYHELKDRLDKVIDLRAEALKDYLIDIELQADRVHISKALKDHRHTESGEVMIPYEIQK